MDADNHETGRIENAFLSDIVAHPEDDSPRLIFADWLEDHGEVERAEFIRVQCQAAQLRAGDPLWLTLQDRADDLLAEHEWEWLGPADGLYNWDWRRGFVEKVSVAATANLEPARPQFERHPVREAGFSTPSWDLEKMVATPFLERMERMVFGVPNDESEHRRYQELLLELLASSRLGRLLGLDLGGGSPEGLLATLARQPSLPPLTVLRVEKRLTEEDAIALGSPTLVGLTDVGGFDGMDSAALARLLLTPDRWTGLGLGWEGLAASDLAGLADCPKLQRLVLRWPGDSILSLPPSLEHLEINSVEGEGPRPGVLARSLVGVRLRHLEYRWEPIGQPPDGGDWQELQELLTTVSAPVVDLTLTDFVTDPLPELTRLAGLGSLRSLTLETDVSDAGVEALAGCEELTGLSTLDLGSCISSARLHVLAKAPWLRGLRSFRLHGSAIGDDATVTFLESPLLSRLFSLEMLEAEIGLKTVEFLTGWPGLRRLRRLNLLFNRLPAEAGERLRPHFGRRLSC